MERHASAVAIDSQSVKKVGFIAIATGVDGGKKVNGRKRHLAVDKLGLPLAISVSAANVHDSEGGYDLLWQIEIKQRPDANRPYRRGLPGIVQQSCRTVIQIEDGNYTKA